MSDSKLYTEILKSEPVPLTTKQLSDLKEKYADMILEGMDTKSLEQFVFDTIVDGLKDYSEEEIKEEIVDCYGEETLEDLLS